MTSPIIGMTMMMTLNNTLTAIPGIRVGHATNLDSVTGCTVILCPDGTVGGVDQRGGAPGTRETDLLRPLHLVQTVNAIVLSGGSAYGLATADGVMRYLEEEKIGFVVGDDIVPIVPAAILFDLGLGGKKRPDAEMGYAACQSATDAPVAQGNVGAGTGCQVGRLMGGALATKAGIGSALVDLGDGLYVGALIAVNCAGDVVDEHGSIIAGLREPDNPDNFMGTLTIMRAMARMVDPPAPSNTVIGVVATNAKLTKEETNKVAQMAQDGLAQAIRPAHTMLDGDTIFALATGEIPANVNAIGAFAAETTAQAIRNGVRAATTLSGIRAWND